MRDHSLFCVGMGGGKNDLPSVGGVENFFRSMEIYLELSGNIVIFIM